MVQNSFRHIIILSVVLLSAVRAVATQADYSWITPLNNTIFFSQITVNEGLSSNSIRSLMQDRYGYIWIGTDRGLNRWDGYEMVFYRKTNGLPITSMYEAGDTVWIATEGGLYLYSQQGDSICRFVTNNTSIDISRINISCVKADGGGNVWLSSMTDGLLRIDAKSGEIETIPTPEKSKSYGALFIDKDDGVWAASNWTAHPLIRFDPRRRRFDPAVLRFEGRSPGSYPTLALTQGSDGYVWIAGSRGEIIRFDPATLNATLELDRTETGIGNVHSIVEVHKGYFLIGSDYGMMLYSAVDHVVRHHTTTSETRSQLSDNFVYPILTDREGGVWIGTFYGGVNYYHPTLSNFATHVHNRDFNSVSGNVINHFAEDRLGRIWIASDDGGLSCYDPKAGSFRAVSLSATATYNVHALAVKGDNLYVGTYGQGMSIVDVNTLKVTNIPSMKDAEGAFIDVSSYEMMVDRQGRVWVGTFDALCLYDEQSQVFHVKQRLKAPVIDMMQAGDGTLWFTTETNGLWSYSDKTGKWRQYDSRELLLGADNQRVAVNSLCEDAGGRLMCGTSAGLLRYNRSTDTFEQVDLPVNVHTVQSVACQGGYLWLATNAGLCRYSLANSRVEQTFKGGNFVTTDFLPGAICCSMAGMMYVGTTHGFVEFSPQAMHHNSVPPQVRFTGLEVLNKRQMVGDGVLTESLNHTKELKISHKDNVVRLSFAALSFVEPNDNTYSYYLEGFDADWIDAGNHHSVTYTNLSPGTYVFHVRATNNDGVFSPESTLRIVVTPPFYWNTTAQVVYVLVIVLCIYYAVRRIMRKAERRHKAEIEEIHTQAAQEIEEINTQKAQEIEEINIQKEQEIQEINTQKEQEVHEARIKFMTITPRDQEFLDRLEEAIEKNFANPDLSVDVLAQAVGISRTGLFTKLKTLADVTPNEMIQVIRLKHAASLLQENRYRVSEVCYMVGFSSPSYFSKCFCKQYGVTPAKYCD